MKNNKIFVFLMSFVFALVLPFIFSSSQVAFAGEEDFVSIQSYQDLKQKFALEDAFEKNYKLDADLDLTEVADFVPIGLSTENGEETFTSFKGVFDGNGHKIVGLNFNQDQVLYTFGLFAKLENATVKNLILQDILIDNPETFNFDILNNKSIMVGGVSALSEASLLENLEISFANVLEEIDGIEQQKVNKLSGRKFDFGGVVAKAFYGTTIRNVKVSSNLAFEIETEKLQTLNAGLVVGELYNSYLHNVIASGSLRVENNNDQANLAVVNLAGIAGNVERAASLIQATYSNVVFETKELDEQKLFKGALVGAVKETEAPNDLNISYNVFISKNKINDVLQDFNNPFGKVAGYDKTGSIYNFLTRDNFTILEENAYWNGLLSSYKWNTKNIWKSNSSSLPSLQMFDSYNVSLSIEKTRINLASSILPQDLLVLAFEEDYELEDRNVEKPFKYNENVNVLIALINDFDIYYKLQSVEINGTTAINKFGTVGNYTLTQIEVPIVEEPVEGEALPEHPYANFNSNKVYLFSFNASNFDSGEISVTLEKVGFELNVKTQNADEGRVRRKEAQNPSNSINQTLFVGSIYEFVAVPVNNNFALDRWVMELVDEVTLEPYFVELEEYGNLSNISFEFGKTDASKVTENFLNGGKLVAIFSSNITKVTFMIEEGEKGENKNAGQIFDGNEVEEFVSSSQVSFLKGRTFTFIAKEKTGYTFKGWYDDQNRLREKNQVLTYETNQDEDEITLIAVYEQTGGFASLTTLWIVLGSLAGVAIIVVVIVVIKRKRSDMSYRNFY